MQLASITKVDMQGIPITYLKTGRHPYTEDADVDQRDDSCCACTKKPCSSPVHENNTNPIYNNLRQELDLNYPANH